MPVTPPPTPSNPTRAVWKVAIGGLPLPRLFDYRPIEGDDGAVPGCRVRVPFGSRERIGVIAAVGPADDDGADLKPALERLDATPLLAGELWDSLRWLAHYTHEPFGEVVATALPTLLRHGEPLPHTDRLGWRLSAAGVDALPRLRPGRPRRLAERLAQGEVAEDELDSLFDDWRAALRSLDGRGLVEQVVMTPATAPAQPGPEPNDEQRAAIDALLASRDAFGAFLLDGITGSGKTEVYLHAIADCLARGKQALVLVPEIGLTPQTLARFRARLGVPVYALHSGLSDGERARTWAACLRGQARVVVGTRSAVFLPLPDAGLIVVDEEHDGSYKQLDGIRYHARDFAIYRASQLNVPIVLGSATPSMESLRNARTQRYTHLHLRKRAGVAKPPAVRVIDIRKRALDAGLSNELIDALSRTLEAGGQALVFKNRRGYAPVLLCHDCGWSAECPRCDASMTVHAKGRRLQCHHCGASKRSPDACPDCGGLALQPQGAGTEKLEETLAARFPQVPVVRIDKGTTRNRDALVGHIEALGQGPGLLVGTQMLAKGHDLPGLTLVAVVGIDEGLFSADFRAPEKLAQLLVQVSGRAGRADRPGEVLLQTHHPEHPLLHTLLTGGYAQFADEELALREEVQFPPFAHMAMFRAEARDMDVANAFLVQVRAHLEATSPGAVLTTHGPLPAPMPRRAGYQRAQLVVSSNARPALHAALDAALPSIRELPEARRVRWSLDVDPVDLY
ncbi:primosomal protein N' [Lysobacter xinjiangensis]|uniref:Replication restart protein PriA n=1 Tax=Cognatilysobacter xinjiangensis TaxID=546892 RepID=A0ABQ3C5U2_9GAMM|nr:primosomal protein N' [Lysobacter xinjiangensis]GGZ69801.1 primosomal protein N' [Lysobacter xinjiangensis]